MHPTEAFQKYSLMCREKLGNKSSRQFLRLGKMLLRAPFSSCRQGILKTMVGLTYDCQCNCAYCCAGLYPKNKENELSVLEIKALIKDISRLPSLCTLISFFGGEALLKESIFELIKYACQEGLFTETETNGILLSSGNVRKLKQAGLHHIFIRIESTDQLLHDAISGFKGCWQSALEGIKCCVSEKLSCSISTIAFKDKIYNGQLERIIEMAKRLGASSVRIIYPTPAGKLTQANQQMLGELDKQAVRRLLRPDFVYLESTQVCTKQGQRICPAQQKKMFYISCYGEVQPCPFVPLDFGNIRQEKINGILSRMHQEVIFNGPDHGDCLMSSRGLEARE